MTALVAEFCSLGRRLPGAVGDRLAGRSEAAVDAAAGRDRIASAAATAEEGDSR